jgi:hypothetical protein
LTTTKSPSAGLDKKGIPQDSGCLFARLTSYQAAAMRPAAFPASSFRLPAFSALASVLVADAEEAARASPPVEACAPLAFAGAPQADLVLAPAAQLPGAKVQRDSVVPQADGLLAQAARLDDLPPDDLVRVDCFPDGCSLAVGLADSVA